MNIKNSSVYHTFYKARSPSILDSKTITLKFNQFAVGWALYQQYGQLLTFGEFEE